MTDQEQKADQIIFKVRDLLADLWELDLPEDARRERMETIKAMIDIHYLTEGRVDHVSDF